MNVYDSQKIADVLFESHGMELVFEPREADVILLNTCAVRGKAEEKVFSDLGRIKVFKKLRPEIVIGVGGCVATQEGRNILIRAPYVDFVFGPQVLHRIPSLYNEVIKKRKRLIDTEFLKNEKFLYFPPARADGPSAFVSIMEGCNQFCSYCVVPHTRGPEVSRPFNDVIHECTELALQGVTEINLLGQNVNAYCDKGKDLADILYALAKNKDILRIRFMTSHPKFFSERLLEAFRLEPKIVNHLHLPVQSGSNTILKAMRRGYTVEANKDKIAALREIRPDIAVSSDFIVGFPGETDTDFQETLDLVSEIKFDHSFSFIYSPRPNTKAALFEDTLPLKTKKERLKILQILLLKFENAINQNMRHTEQEILVTGFSRKNSRQLMGRAENNRIVNFENKTGEDLVGKIVNIKITEILRNSLRGELASRPQKA